jgi:hypothetical protein
MPENAISHNSLGDLGGSFDSVSCDELPKLGIDNALGSSDGRLLLVSVVARNKGLPALLIGLDWVSGRLAFSARLI